jgi:galactose-1-phosphate uridylyltransferase
MVVPKQHKRSLVDFTKEERAQLAECIAEITRRYDNLFETQFPYSMSNYSRIRLSPVISTSTSTLRY